MAIADLASLAKSLTRRRFDMAYFTLAVKHPEGVWMPQFGDYSKKVVKQEQEDTKSDWPKGTQFKIVATTSARQCAVNDLIEAMNKKEV